MNAKSEIPLHRKDIKKESTENTQGFTSLNYILTPISSKDNDQPKMAASGASPYFMWLHTYYHQHFSAKASEALCGDRTLTCLLLQAYLAISRDVQRWALA